MGLRVARIRRWLRNSCTRNIATSYNREPARPSAGGRNVTDDYDFRASERRRARELDELEARRLRARERQRAQLRAAHRRRRLGVLAVLGIVDRRRQRRVGLDERHAEGASARSCRPSKTAEHRPSPSRGRCRRSRAASMWRALGQHSRQSRRRARDARPQPDRDRRQGRERRGLGPRGRHAGAGQALRRRARLLRPRARRAARARPPHLGRRPHRQLQGPDRRRSTTRRSRSTTPQAPSGTTAAASRGSTSTARRPGRT